MAEVLVWTGLPFTAAIFFFFFERAQRKAEDAYLKEEKDEAQQAVIKKSQMENRKCRWGMYIAVIVILALINVGIIEQYISHNRR